jgi:hypothetical protein
MVTTLHQYISAAHFAKKCGVQTRCINQRARQGFIDAIKADGFWFVNTETTPITQHRKRNAKPAFRTPTTPTYAGNLKNLRRIPTIAQQHHMLPNHIYEAVILGKLDAIIIGNIPYIDITNPNLRQFLH